MSTGGLYPHDQGLERNRQALRLSIVPSDEIGQLKAAWTLGRLLNEMRFRLESAWILNRDDEPERTERSWSDMTAMIRRVLEPRHARAVRAIDITKDEWNHSFGSEWHSELLHEANQNLNLYFSERASLPHNFAEVDHLRSVCASVTESFDRLLERILSELPTSARAALSLGQTADELIHPRLNSSVLRIVRTSTSSLGWDVSEAANSGTFRNVLQIPNCVGVPWPDAGWRQTAAHRHSEFCQSILNHRELCVLSWSDETPLFQMLDDLQATVECSEGDWERPETVSEIQVARLTPRGQRYAREIGLTITPDERYITVQGNNSGRQLSSVYFRLLIHFLNCQPDPTPTRWLCENWSLFSPDRTSPIGEDSVRTMIGQLRSHLDSFGVAISPVGGGYRLMPRRDEA